MKGVFVFVIFASVLITALGQQMPPRPGNFNMMRQGMGGATVQGGATAQGGGEDEYQTQLAQYWYDMANFWSDLGEWWSDLSDRVRRVYST